MRLKSWWNGAAVCSGMIALLGVGVASSAVQTSQRVPPAAGPVLPAGPGHDAFLKTCTGCHLTAVVTAQRKSADDWTSTVIEMRSRGAVGTDAELEEIIGYLAANFGPSVAPSRVKVNEAPSAEIAATLAIAAAQADAIVAYREKNGRFKDVGELEKVPGVDAAKVEAAKDRIDF